MTIFFENPTLLEAYRRGERGALEAVFKAYVSEVTRIVRLGFVSGSAPALRIPGLRDEAALRDAVQEVFVRAFQPAARQSFDGVRPFRPFLLQIARNLRLDQLRRGSRELPVSTLTELARHDDEWAVASDGGEPSACDPQVGREWNTLCERTRRIVATMDDKSQEFIRLRFVEGRAQADVAERMSVTRRHVRTLETHILRAVRLALKT